MLFQADMDLNNTGIVGSMKQSMTYLQSAKHCTHRWDGFGPRHLCECEDFIPQILSIREPKLGSSAKQTKPTLGRLVRDDRCLVRT